VDRALGVYPRLCVRWGEVPRVQRDLLLAEMWLVCTLVVVAFPPGVKSEGGEEEEEEEEADQEQALLPPSPEGVPLAAPLGARLPLPHCWSPQISPAPAP